MSWPIESLTLENGLRVVLQPDDSLPLVTVNLWYHVGSKDERPGRTGFAHLFEHMLFQGSQNVGTNDHFRLIQQVGGVANGSTWFDRTNYYETLPSHHLELGLWLEADRLGRLLPAMTEEKLETQKEVVMNERRQRVDNQPYGSAFERLQALLFPLPHPYNWPVIGTMEDIAAAGLDEVRSFFETYYAPRNAVLTLAGDLPAGVERLVERHFGNLPPGARPERTPPPLPPLGKRRLTIDDRVALARVYLAVRCPAYGTPDWYAADLLTTVLTGGKSSPLYRDLVHRRRLAQDVAAFVLPTESVSALVLTATASPGTEPEELEEQLLGHLRRLRGGELEAIELARARRRQQTAWEHQVQTTEHRADLLSRATTFFDDPHRAATEMERYDGLDPDDLVDFARRHLTAAERVSVTVVPGGEPA